MFVIDDGSTDDTKCVVESFIPRFSEKGYILEYVYQDNQGQSVAINNGIKRVHGDYLVWPDADDFYKTNDAIEILVDALNDAGDGVASARCLPEYINEYDLRVESSISPNQVFNEYLFEDCLYNNDDFWFCSGGYVVRFNIFKKMFPCLNIYTEKNAGQNWQLLLPIFFNYRCITVQKVMYSVLKRGSSHSRGQYATRLQINEKYRSYRNTIVETLKLMPDIPVKQKKYYIKTIKKKYRKLILINDIRPIVHRIKFIIKTIKLK